MTTEDLRELLISASFNERAYGILEEKESAWCILFEDGVWTVAENMERMYAHRLTRWLRLVNSSSRTALFVVRRQAMQTLRRCQSSTGSGTPTLA